MNKEELIEDCLKEQIKVRDEQIHDLNEEIQKLMAKNSNMERTLEIKQNHILIDEIKRLNKCIDEALEIIIKDWNDKCTIPIHSVVDTGNDIRIKLYYQLFFKGVDKE